jgi:predicted lipoprotein with Yx(FWY)xxD motif
MPATRIPASEQQKGDSVKTLPAVNSGRRLLTVIVPSVALLFVAACGSSSKSTTTNTTTTNAYAPASTPSAPASTSAAVSTATVPGLGAVLVNGQGHTLYIFAPDNAKRVTCVSSCALVWPPLKLAAGATPTASGEAKLALVSSVPNPEGGRVVTYAGWPLYTYVADSGAGTAKGQALLLNGGYWYVISPSGQAIHKAP